MESPNTNKVNIFIFSPLPHQLKFRGRLGKRIPKLFTKKLRLCSNLNRNEAQKSFDDCTQRKQFGARLKQIKFAQLWLLTCTPTRTHMQLGELWASCRISAMSSCKERHHDWFIIIHFLPKFSTLMHGFHYTSRIFQSCLFEVNPS